MSNKLPYRTLVYANDTITASARRPSVTPLVILGDTFCGLCGPVTLLFKAVLSLNVFLVFPLSTVAHPMSLNDQFSFIG
jgi:hypothetical protein